MNTFTEALRDAVSKDGRLKKEIALAAGLDPGQFSRYMRGSEPSASTLRRLIAVLPDLREWVNQDAPAA